MNRFLAIVALTGFVSAGAVHGFALAGVDVSEQLPFVWVLHLGIFVVFFPFVFSIRKVLGPRPSLDDLQQLLPRWVFFICQAVFIYALANFALSIVLSQGGSPSIEEGKYVLQNHGSVIREINQAEYVALRANQLRGFSGHWLLFYFMPFAYFMFSKDPGSSMSRAAAPGGEFPSTHDK